MAVRPQATPATNIKPVELTQATESPREKGPSALDDPDGRGLPKPLVDTEHHLRWAAA
jgi:hypothetical protein